MKINFKKILNELSYRVSSGIPDLTNEQHLMKLWDILKENNWNIDARVELLKNLQEKIGKVYVQKGKGPSGVKLQVGPRGGKYYMGNPETGEPAKEQPKSKEKDKDVKVKSKKRDFLSKKIESRKDLTEDEQKLFKNVQEQIDILYDDNATDEQKKKAAQSLIDDAGFSTNAGGTKAYINKFAKDRKIFGINASSKDLVSKVKEQVDLKVVNTGSIATAITSKAKPDLGKENITKVDEHPRLKKLHDNPPLSETSERQRGIYAVKDENGNPKLPSNENTKEYLNQSFSNPALKNTIEEVQKHANDGNVSQKAVEALKEHEKTLSEITDKYDIPSQEASDAVLQSYQDLILKLQKEEPDYVSSIMKQFGEMALYETELAQGKEVYMPSSPTFPVGDKILVEGGKGELETVSQVSCKWGKQGRIYGCPANFKGYAELHQDESKRDTVGMYVGQEGYTLGIKDDLLTGNTTEESIEKTSNHIDNRMKEMGLGDVFDENQRKQISSIITNYSEEIKKAKEEIFNDPKNKGLKKSELYGLLNKKTAGIKEKLSKQMGDVVTDEQLEKLVGKNNIKNFRKRDGTIDPSTIISAVEVTNNIRTNERMAGVKHNVQYLDDKKQPKFETKQGSNDPNDYSLTTRMYRTTGRTGGGIQSSFTGDGKESDEIITPNGNRVDNKTGEDIKL
jgi:hypothetical protein